MTAAALQVSDPNADALVGRQRELEFLLRCFEAASDSQGTFCLITGEPGIGKTRLASELGERVGGRGGLVIWGRCWEGGGAPAFWPWIQVLRSARRRISDLPLDPAQQQQLDLLLAESSLDANAAPNASDSERARFRLFDTVCRVLHHVARAQPLLILLEDIHAADTASLQLLRFLARDVQGSRILAVATSRSIDLHRDPDRGRVFHALLRDAHQMPLGGLSFEEVSSLCTAVASHAVPSALVAAIYEATDGNPFFVDEIMRLLVADGTVDQPAFRTQIPLRVPAQVRDVIRQRMESLQPDTRRVLAIAAVIGREFEERTLQEVISTTEPLPALEALRVATDNELLTGAASVAGRYRFSHMLIADTLYHDLPATLRCTYHGVIGSALERLYALNLDAHLAELAHHFSHADTDQAAKAFAYAERAAHRATRLLAFEEAALWYEKALHFLDNTGGTSSQRCELLLQAGDAHRFAGDFGPAAAAYKQAAALGRSLKQPNLLARAAAGLGRAMAETGVVNAPLVALLEEALDALPTDDSVLRVMVLSRLAVALYFAPNDARRASASREALEMARRLGNSSALADALLTRHFALAGPGHADERVELATDLVRLGEQLGDHDAVMDGLAWRIVDRFELGDMDTATAEVGAFHRLALNQRRARDQWHGVLLEAALALFHGRLEQAQQLSQRAFELGQYAEAENAAQFFGVQSFLQHHARGTLNVLEPTVRDFVERYPTLAIWRCGLALLLAETGRLADAAAELSRLAVARFEDFAQDLNWLPSLCILSEVCAQVGDTQAAGVLEELLTPYAGGNVAIATGAGLCGSVSYFLGRLAAARGDTTRASALFERALTANLSMGAVAWAAQTQWALAEHCIAAQPNDPALRQRALSLVEQAHRTASAIGMRALEQRSGVLLGTLGPHRSEDLSAPADPVGLRLDRGDDYWLLSIGRTTLRLQDSKGMRYLAQLVRHPGTAFRATELQDLELAPQSKGDDQPDAERERLGTERARLNVTRAIAAALRRIRAHDEVIGHYLLATVRTGTACQYKPSTAALKPS